MKIKAYGYSIALLLMAGLVLHAENSATQIEKKSEKIGVYDSRAIAIAFTGSDIYKKQMDPLMAEFDKAKAAGDQKRIEELKTEGANRQKLRHKQGFSTAPVDDILENIKNELLEIEKKEGFSVIISKWDKGALSKHPKAELVDVTMMLVDAFHPSEKQRKSAIEIQKHDPISLEQADKIND